MAAVIISILKWLARYWRKEPITLGALALAPVPQEKQPVPQPLPIETNEPQLLIQPSPKARQSESVSWHFRSTILDRLDEYFVCVRRLRRHDADAYALFARVGFAVPADRYVNPEHTEMRSLIHDSVRPAFGGILCGGWTDYARDLCFPGDKRFSGDHQCFPSFLYFTKIETPSRIEQHRGAIYRVTSVFDDRRYSQRWHSTLTAVLHFHAVISDDGSVEILRELQRSRSNFPVKRGRRRERIELSQCQWQYPQWLADFSADCPEPFPNDPFGIKWARYWFLLAFLTHQLAVSRIIVRAQHDGQTAAFGIDVTRAKYFFADREIDLAIDGKRKRIFHAVAEHDRRIDPTRTTRVRGHYRGSRHFEWNGHRIRIVMPRNNEFMTIPVPMKYKDDVPKDKRKEMVTTGTVAKQLDGILSS